MVHVFLILGRAIFRILKFGGQNWMVVSELGLNLVNKRVQTYEIITQKK